jgi:hypothetical protein
VTRIARNLAAAFVIFVSVSAVRAERPVSVHRLPPGAVQPQLAVDASGVVHLIYLAGDPGQADIFYIRSTDYGKTWSTPLRVNSQRGTAIAIGTVRGPHLAVGRNGIVHVAWMGSSLAEPRGPGKATPMLYSRIVNDRAGFEPQRNVMSAHPGLDGGASVAADSDGNVFVAWHAPEHLPGKEQDRRLWVARSADDGQTFAPEVPLSPASTGACGCCGMRIAATGGKIFALYRGAAEEVNRGMYRIIALSDLSNPQVTEIAPMKIGICVMSTAALSPTPKRMLAAWETEDEVFWSMWDPTHPADAPVYRPANPSRATRKHPAIAASASGQVLLTWAEGTGWNKGGKVGWQLFDPDGKAVERGKLEGLPVWGSPAVFAGPGRDFVLIY